MSCRLSGRFAFLAGCLLGLAGTLAGAFVPGRAAGQEAEKVVTLEEAVAAALQSHPSLIQGRGAVRTAEAGERTAWGAFLPSLSLSSGASLSSTERFNPQTNTTVRGSNDSYSAGVSASLDIFTAGRRGAELRRARAATEAAEASLVNQRFAVILSVKQAFFDVLRADELIRVAEAGLNRAREGLEAAQHRMDAGTATRSDVLRAELEIANARQALLQAQAQRRTAAFALGRLIGVDGAVGARLTQPLEPRPLPVSDEELAAMVLQSAPSVRAAESAARSAEAGVAAARTAYFPSLRFSGGYDWFNQNAALNGGRTSWGMRLSLSYPLFNGFAREASVERAEVEADVARAQLEDARRAARAELERVLADLRLAEQRIALTGEAVRVAEEDLRVQQERYRLGASTILEQITSQVNLLQAELDRVAARYDYQIARAQLEALVGREL
ncbi:MAG TPA: TolC family protein [Longimicrobiales bacterium]